MVSAPPRLAPFGSGVASVVPGGFPAYVRILHRARGINDEPLRWADVAAEPPHTGDLQPELVRALCEVLAEHTNTRDSGWFCLWRGYGWLNEGAGNMGIQTIGSPEAPPTIADAEESRWLSA